MPGCPVKVDLENILIWKLSWDDSGIVQDIFRNHFGVGNKLKSLCWIQKLKFSFFFENLNFQFSSKIQFLGHEFQDPSCRICSYRPHGPFWFSVKNGRDMEKRYQKKNVGEKSFFEINVKMN